MRLRRFYFTLFLIIIIFSLMWLLSFRKGGIELYLVVLSIAFAVIGIAIILSMSKRK